MQTIKRLLIIACCLIALGDNANAQQVSDIVTNDTESAAKTCADCCDPNVTSAPLGIMTDHMHGKGKWMASYSYMDMVMKGNRIGGSTVSDDAVYQQYMMLPDKMSMQMHMVMLMYGVTDRLTLMAMTGFAVNDMTMSMNGKPMTMPDGTIMQMSSGNMESISSGLTDTRLYGLYSLFQKNAQRLIGTLGVSIPTGSINSNGITMLGTNERLSYPMQLGTGSFGLLPSVTYTAKGKDFSWGAAAGADIKLNNNANGYKYGNAYNSNVWVSHSLLPFMSGSLRAEAIMVDKITGSDPLINNPYNIVGDPTANPANSGGIFGNIYAGLNVHFNEPYLRNFRLLTEFGLPVYQNVNGTQMAVHSNFSIGVQYTH